MCRVPWKMAFLCKMNSVIERLAPVRDPLGPMGPCDYVRQAKLEIDRGHAWSMINCMTLRTWSLMSDYLSLSLKLTGLLLCTYKKITATTRDTSTLRKDNVDVGY